MKTVLKVDGMSCKHCVKRVEEAAKSVAGVKGVSVDLKKGQAEIVHDADIIGAVKAAIAEQGYEVA